MSALPLGAKAITNWQPTRLTESVVACEWQALVGKLFGIAHIARADPLNVVRPPYHHHANGKCAWHFDGASRNVYLVMWSNLLPTMVRLADGTRLRTKRGDVLLLDNRLVEHRADKRVLTTKRRWFARAMIKPRG